MLIRYILILSFTFIDLFLLKKFLLYFNKKIKYFKFYFIFSIFISFLTLFYKSSISHHMETNLKISRAILIFTEITYLLSFISLTLSLMYLKLYYSFTKKKNIISNKNIDLSKTSNGDKSNNIQTTTRRDFIKEGALLFPLASVLFTTKGAYNAYSTPLFIDLKLKYKNLPKSLVGLKIAQISDLHLGIFITLKDLSNILEKLNRMNLDLLLITGDFIDEYSLLDDAVKMLRKVKPKYGIYSSPGNHEYSRGISPVLRTFRKYKIPYFVSKGIRIKIKDDYLFVGGVDDSHAVKSNKRKGYLEKSLNKTIKYSKDDDFKILMSHRYKVFQYSVLNKVHLTLSGHSHGAQIGFNGKSLFEGFNGHKHLWGKYRQGDSILYTTSGAGHWFPFRINCPTEVPIFTLIN